jgi:4-hydroxybutyrate CoA-transferase
MVAINAALMVDLTGQIAAESIGPTMVSGTGGQLAFAIGSALSKGGRNITVLASTARGGEVSRIVPQLELGTAVTVPRTLADIVVTEYGIAKLKGKTQRQRAEELISVAHPDFRAELRREAQRLF